MASGCGRPLGTRDAGQPPADALLDLGGADLATDVATEVADAPVDLPSEGGPDAVDPGCGSLSDVHHCGSCDHDCTALPNIAGTTPDLLTCENGVCHAGCAHGYEHCSLTTTDQGCETDEWSDPQNCGFCGITCGQVPGSPGVCHNGACVGEPCPAGYADCNDQLGCETWLTSPSDCGACGRPACGLAHVVAPCRQPTPSCDDGICAAGYGNCDRANPDCEAAYGSAGSCLPVYEGTAWLPTNHSGVAAVGPDGTRFLGGRFDEPIDFDFTGGVDVRNPNDTTGTHLVSPYVTMVRPDGGYGWTRTFATSGANGAAGQATVDALVVPPDGGIIAGGFLQGSIALDPDDVDNQSTGPAFIVKLDDDGRYVWGLTITSTASGAVIFITSLAVGSDGSIYVRGAFIGEADFDPGPAAVIRTGGTFPAAAPFLWKLNADLSFGWVDVWSDSRCSLQLGRIAVSDAGRIWMGGSHDGACDFDPGPGVDLKQTADQRRSEGYLLALDAAGGYVGTWIFGDSVADVTTDDQGAVYAAGTYSGTVDFDPGPAEALRTAVDVNSSFIVVLNAGGGFEWVSTQTGFAAGAIALERSGNVLVAGTLNSDIVQVGVVELFPDQSLGWTLGFAENSHIVMGGVTATASGLFVSGATYWDADMDPGPGVDTVAGADSGNPFISAFAF